MENPKRSTIWFKGYKNVDYFCLEKWLSILQMYQFVIVRSGILLKAQGPSNGSKFLPADLSTEDDMHDIHILMYFTDLCVTSFNHKHS